MRNLSLLLILLFSCFSAQSQKISLVRIDAVKVDADVFVGFDKFGYYYFIKDDALIKIKNGQTSEYKNVATGKITKVDIQNPLLVVVFYETFNTVVLLDNQMNEVRAINFNDLNLDNGNTQLVVHATGLASQNRLWIYDSLSQQLGLFDYLTNDYRAIGIPITENIGYYQTDFNNFRWIDDKRMQYVTDVFGKVGILGKIEEDVALQFISNSQIMYVSDGKLNVMDWSKSMNYSIPDVENSFKNFYYKDQILSIFTNEGITNYKITLP